MISNKISYLAASVSYSLLLISSIFSQPASTLRQHNNYTDLESLLAFKSQVSDPFGILTTNWTANASFCDWIGVQCSNNPRHQRVTALDLHGVVLKGTISAHLGNLSFLSYLNLNNCSLDGRIPDILGKLPRLSVLGLANNTLSGPIPNSIFNISSLIIFSVFKNNLFGPLPSNDSSSSSIMLPHLQFISLSFNQLTGEIPSSFAQCKDLQSLGLSNNQLTGTILAELSYLPRLTELYLASNYLNGPIPASLGNLTTLNALDLLSNNLTGTIPGELGNLLNLQLLDLGSNYLSGSIPMSLLNASMVNLFLIGSNNIAGMVPTTIGKSMPQLQRLFLFGNHLSGGLDFITSLSNCRALRDFDFSINELEGVLPLSIGNLSMQLQYVDADSNRISGNIPSVLGNLSGLTYLNLYGNQLNGPIPLELSKLKMIRKMYLLSNGLSGPIPRELGQLKSLIDLRLSANKLSGPIPDSLGNLTQLQELGLYGNSLSSSIPRSLWNLVGLIGLDLSKNLLSGTLPLQMGNLQVLNKLYLQDNQLSGNILDALGALQMLSYLDLSNNSFSGQIPQALGSIINIEYMNLSHNGLSGYIPNSLATLRYLKKLDLSFNNLYGKIPQGKVFSNLSIPSLQGNKALCGALKLGFPPCPENMRTSTSTSTRRIKIIKYITFPVASALVLLACFYFLSKFLQSRKAEVEIPSDTQRLTNYRSISYHELVRATENFSEENLLGKGSCSSVFKACLDDGTITALKVINLASEGTSKSFEVECRALSTARHRNLVKIISICSNLDFKSILLQFMQNGSLEKWLYSSGLLLNLLQRLQIILDVAIALEYLHHYHPCVIIHCDLKPSNVLLDENMVAHVGDFGIAKLFYGDSVATFSTNAQGTIGYMAPEYGLIGKISTKGDVYSFGILLLETITGRKPSDAMFNEELNLRQWVNRADSLSIMEIVDYRIFGDDNLHGRKSEALTNIQQCLSSMIEVGLLCTMESPKERLSMKDVVPRLQKMKLKYLASLHTY